MRLKGQMKKTVNIIIILSTMTLHQQSQALKYKPFKGNPGYRDQGDQVTRTLMDLAMKLIEALEELEATW